MKAVEYHDDADKALPSTIAVQARVIVRALYHSTRAVE